MFVSPADLDNAWVLSNGHPIRYWRSVGLDRQSMHAFVLLHGFGVSGASLLPTATLLARTAPTFVPNLPGSGHSPRSSRVLSIPELRNMLLGFLDALGIEHAILVGHSMGAILSLEAARSAPQRVRRLILVAPADGTRVRSLGTVATQLACEAVREPLRLQTIVLADLVRFGPLNAGRLYAHLRHYPMIDRLRSVAPPTIVVLGSRDPLVNVTRIIEGVGRLERVQVACVDGAAHGIPYTHALQLDGLIESSLEDDHRSDGQKGTW